MQRRCTRSGFGGKEDARNGQVGSWGRAEALKDESGPWSEAVIVPRNGEMKGSRSDSGRMTTECA